MALLFAWNKPLKRLYPLKPNISNIYCSLLWTASYWCLILWVGCLVSRSSFALFCIRFIWSIIWWKWWGGNLWVWSFIEKSCRLSDGSLRKDFELWSGIKSLIGSTTTYEPTYFPLHIEQAFYMSVLFKGGTQPKYNYYVPFNAMCALSHHQIASGVFSNSPFKMYQQIFNIL